MFLRLAALLILGNLIGSPLLAAEVSVTLESGRTVAGAVSVKTDDAQLWINSGSGGIKVVRPIDWDRIVSATVDGEAISVDQLRQQQFALEEPEIRIKSEIIARPVQQASYEEETYVPRLASLQVYATLENWDYDIIADGLRLTIDARDQYGRTFDLQGQYDAELYAFKRYDFYTVPSQRGVVSTRIGRWGGTIDSQAGANPIRLTYQGQNPELDDSFAPEGLLKVRIVVPGQGVFERKVDWVRIRTWSPYRDYSQLNQSPNLPYHRR
ncbi:hypothetical protein LOC68_05570 [Blastopirellula sp. JC732]|uniref:Uncharacterized protein n=1 Tax=Blastopirellula sediminis TaxID=2894196 RepID=A0A9X1MJU1_9BACT|nr:hypothetical protein [Blastopirellula sediminis]MCC9609367.1 hypothetical protein [Blastopirellula sediminis]MCC9627856.1 hypothetical protein [Blastopirellula sediminis]